MIRIAEHVLSTEGVEVRRLRHESEPCIVTFSNYADATERGGTGFGETFFDARRIDAIHVVARDNSWFHYAEMPRVIAAIRAAIGERRRVFTYGSSMGGFAAIRFAEALGAVEAIAISPQYTIERRIVPFEQRWRREAARIRFQPWPDMGDPPRVIAFFDPRGPDGRHVAMWHASRTVIDVPLPFAGHPAAIYLAQIDLLTPAILDILAARFDPAAFTREAWRRRRTSAQYLATLAIAQPRARRALAIRLLRAAVERLPDSAHILSDLAIRLYQAGRQAEAETLHRRALALAPDNALLLFRLSRFLQRLDRFEEATPLASKAAALEPASIPLRRHAARLRYGAGSRLDPRRAPLRLLSRAMHGLNRLAWRRGWPQIERLARP